MDIRARRICRGIVIVVILLAAALAGYALLPVNISCEYPGHCKATHLFGSVEIMRVAVEQGREALVLDRNQNGIPDMTQDGWLFLANQDEYIAAAILFSDDGGPRAGVYSGPLRRESAIARAAKGTLGRPLMEARARDAAWLMQNAVPNYNVNLTVYGGGRICNMNADLCLDNAAPNRHETRKDVHVRAYDIDADGHADIEFTSTNPAADADLIVQDVEDRGPSEPFLMWPLLGTAIHVDWDAGRIVALRHLIPTHDREGMWFGLLGRRFSQTELHHGFEFPFTFHDLAADDDGVPESMLRMVDENIHDQEELRRNITTYEEARYSWDQDNDGDVDYRVHVMGKHPYQTTVLLPEYPIRTLPFNDAPDWVFSRGWSWAVFADDEDDNEILSEGIYENGEFTSWLREHLFRTIERPEPPYLPNRKMDREEWRLVRNGSTFRPELYFSPIDRRLHLFGAERGIIILEAPENPAREVSYFDFSIAELREGRANATAHVELIDADGDGHIDTWNRFAQGVLREELTYRGGVLEYTDGAEAARKDVGRRQELFRAPPPTATQDWRELKEFLERQPAPPPWKSLRAIFEMVSAAP